MRNIKFRVWYKPTNQFINHCSVGNGIVQHDTRNFAVLEDKDCVVQQYTGLKDKNGVEICEGDLADWCEDSYIDEHTKPATIVWHEQEGWQCAWYKEDGSESFRDPLYIYVNQHYFKVIGNIFEGVDK